MGIGEYIDYFKQLTIEHPLLLHTEEKKVFLPISMEQALGITRTEIKSKDFSFQLFPYTSTKSGNYNVTGESKHEGGFYILKYHDSPDYIEALKSTEALVKKFINKMIADAEAGHELWMYSLNSQSSFSVTPSIKERSLSYSGFLVTFDWSSVSENCTTWP